MCIGALGGKRVLVCKSPCSGSECYDYKGHYSLIMMALVDANYKFMYVEVGASARAIDAGVWERCGLRDAIEKNIINIPPSTPNPFTSRQCPFVMVGDDAFPLKTYLLKPYPGKDLPNEKLIFNYRLSHARRTSENAFGIMARRFQIYKKPINTSPENVKDIVLATAVLHNYLQVDSGKKHAASHNSHGEHRHEEVEDVLQEAFQRLAPIGRGHSNDAKAVRQTFDEYFNNEGSVAWQAEKVHMH